MTRGRKTENSQSSSAETSKKSPNMNSSHNAEGSMSNIFVEVTLPPLENARTHVVEVDANPRQELEHVDLPSSPQASSPQDLGNTDLPALAPESSSSPDSTLDGDDTASSGSSEEEAEASESGAPAALVDVDAIIASTIARASDAMQKLATLASSREPLWLPDETNNAEIINDVEYMRQFVDINDVLTRTVEAVEEREKKAIENSGNTSESESSEEFGQNPAMISSESSREVEYFRVRPIVIMEHLMDVEHWRATFSNIVAIGSLKVVLESPEEDGNYAGTLQVIHAEFNAITPFIPARESCFARYCKQLGSGLWGVVDVSVDELFRYPPRIYRRLPSGCLIQEMPNGFTKVTWVENAEVDNRLVHSSYQQILSSGFAFGAKRWVNGMIRHFQWHAALRNPIYHGDVNLTIEHTVAYVRLSERMVRAFFEDISAAMSLQLPWAKPVRISRKSNVGDPGRPIGTRMVYMTSVHLPGVPRQQLFNFLHEPQFRPMWDMYAQLHSFDEFAHIPIGEDPRNRVSVLPAVNIQTGWFDHLFVQESYTDSTGSYVVFTKLPWEEDAVEVSINEIEILPCGFTILPDKSTDDGGSLLTVAFQTVIGAPEVHVPSLDQVHTMQNFISNVTSSIQQAMDPNYW